MNAKVAKLEALLTELEQRVSAPDIEVHIQQRDDGSWPDVDITNAKQVWFRWNSRSGCSPVSHPPHDSPESKQRVLDDIFRLCPRLKQILDDNKSAKWIRSMMWCELVIL